VVFLITLIPFDFRFPDRIQIVWTTNFSDTITNVFLFIPVGFLFKLYRRGKIDPYFLITFGAGLLISLSIECAQLFLPGRYTQSVDVVTNESGAWLGALLFKLLEKQLKDGNGAKIFALELPLMNLVYLLIPLLWLNGLSMGGEIRRVWLIGLLGLFGAAILASIYIHRFKENKKLTPNNLSLVVFGWFIVAAIPAVSIFPGQVFILAILIGGVVQAPARFFKKTRKKDRRFELPALKMLLPIYVVYLFFLIFWSTTLPIGEWQARIDFQGLTLHERIVFIFRFIEFIAAFTLLGYMIAQMRGRKNESAGRTLGWVFFTALICSISIEIIRGTPPLLTANISEIVFITTAGLYGGIIYRLQLAAIQRL
jgi:VanZ family protein